MTFRSFHTHTWARMAAATIDEAVSKAPMCSRPWYHPGVEDDQEDCVCVLSIGPPFYYTIPSFDVLQVQLMQLRVMGYDSKGEEQHYDFFIRYDPSLSHGKCPAWMRIKDAAIVKVCHCQTILTHSRRSIQS